jgi:hypothetical protein
MPKKNIEREPCSLADRVTEKRVRESLVRHVTPIDKRK